MPDSGYLLNSWSNPGRRYMVSVYSRLRKRYFEGLNLPPAGNVLFSMTADRDLDGETQKFDTGKWGISIGFQSWYWKDRFMATMLHEMCHIASGQAGCKPHGKSHPRFRKVLRILFKRGAFDSYL
jgi:hypothetical protein